MLFSVVVVASLVPVVCVALVGVAAGVYIYHNHTKEKQVVYWYSNENKTCSKPVSLWQYRLEHYRFKDQIRAFGPAIDERGNSKEDKASKSGTEGQETLTRGRMMHVQGCLEQSWQEANEQHWFKGAGNSVEAFTKARNRQDASLELLFLNADNSIETVQRLLYEELCQRHSLRYFKAKPLWFVCWSTMQTDGHDTRAQAAEQFYTHLDSLTSARNNKISPYADEDDLYKRAYEATVLELQKSNVDVGKFCLVHYTTENQLFAWTNSQPLAWNTGNDGNSTKNRNVAAMIDDLARSPAKDTYAKRWSEGLGISVDYITKELEQEAVAVAKEFYAEASSAQHLRRPVEEAIVDPNFYEISKCFCEGAKGKGFGKLCPRDGQINCSVVDALDALDKNKAGRATHFLSWTWAYSVATFAKTISGWVRKQRSETRSGFKKFKSSEIFLWV